MNAFVLLGHEQPAAGIFCVYAEHYQHWANISRVPRADVTTDNLDSNGNCCKFASAEKHVQSLTLHSMALD